MHATPLAFYTYNLIQLLLGLIEVQRRECWDCRIKYDGDLMCSVQDFLKCYLISTLTSKLPR